MSDEVRKNHKLEEERLRIHRVMSMHRKSDYSSELLIVVGESPNRILYLANRFVLESSDDGGQTWFTLPGTENGISPDENQKIVLHDYDYPISTMRTYRSYGLGESAENSPTLLHTGDTNYTVRYLCYQILDVQSTYPLAPDLASHNVTIPGFHCQIFQRELRAQSTISFTDMRVARQQFEDEAKKWIFESSLLNGFSFALQFRGAQCDGEPGGFLWQIVPTEKSDSTSARIPNWFAKSLSSFSNNSMTVTEFVIRVQERLNRGLMRREPIASLAYWEREVLESHFGGSVEAQSQLHVSQNLWSKIGRLASTHDWRDGRKVSDLTQSLAFEQTMFLLVSCRLLLYRVAMVEGGEPPGDLLTIDNVKTIALREIVRWNNPSG